MQILANQIAKELEQAKHCAVYERDLTRVWPSNGWSPEAKVALFARPEWLAASLLQRRLLRNL
jgi:hypothetical protein